jgi:signal transduction histidine kinase
MGNINDTTQLERAIANLLATHQQPDILLSAIVTTIVTSLGADVGWLIVAQEPLQVFCGKNDTESSDLTVEFALPTTEIFQAIAARNLDRPLVIADLGTEDRLDSWSQALLARSLHSLAIVPIDLNGQIIGYLWLGKFQPDRWRTKDISNLKHVLTLIAIAIDKSHSNAQLQSTLEVQAMLYEKTRQQLEQVSQARKAREEFIDSISHELRTPLTAMNLAIKMLRQSGLPNERRANYFNILEQQCNQEIALVNDLLDWGRLESKQYHVNLQIVNLAELIDRLAQSFADKWTHKGLKLELEFPDSAIELYTDRDILTRILAELLTNAGKYSLEESIIYVRIDPPNPDRQIMLAVTNSGNCIPHDEIGRIFEPLHRPAGTARNAIRGTGLGLALVKSFVQHLHGAIEVSSDPLANNLSCETCFRLTLPQTPENF